MCLLKFYLFPVEKSCCSTIFLSSKSGNKGPYPELWGVYRLVNISYTDARKGAVTYVNSNNLSLFGAANDGKTFWRVSPDERL